MNHCKNNVSICAVGGVVLREKSCSTDDEEEEPDAQSCCACCRCGGRKQLYHVAKTNQTFQAKRAFWVCMTCYCSLVDVCSPSGCYNLSGADPEALPSEVGVVLKVGNHNPFSSKD